MPYRIKVRLAELGLKSVDIIEELRKIGIECTPAQFSNAIKHRDYSPKTETILKYADQIISEKEREKGIIN